MQKIIECIPNFSEGRDKKKINKILKAITDVPGILLLDVESDIAHNRTVITFVGGPKAVVEAAFQAAKTAAQIIDLNRHKGEHPRMGATDVIPLVPISGITTEECIRLAQKLGEKIGNELKIPVYLYEKAAARPENKNLANIRKGEYEGLKKEIGKNPLRNPDFGPKKLGKAGATAIGARELLVAYNINLNTKNIEIAKAIAKKIREKNGGFKSVKALGFELKDRGITQVSMNLTNYKITPPHTVFDAIKKEAKAKNTKIIESEVIGLIPQEALIEAAKHYLKIREFKNEQVLENILKENFPLAGLTIQEFLEEISSSSPTPGGGSVSALTGALAASLILMVANLTIANKKYLSAHKIMQKIIPEVEKIKNLLVELIQKDAEAYQKVVASYKKKQNSEIQKSLKSAALVPLKIGETVKKLLPPLKIVKEKGNKNAASDCGTAHHLIKASLASAILNVEINLKLITDKKFTSSIKQKLKKLQKFQKPL